MKTVRLNVTLPMPLANELKQITAPRKLSKFVSNAIAKEIKRLKEQKLKELLVEGYQATRKEGLELAGDFEQLDLEGWDDY